MEKEIEIINNSKASHSDRVSNPSRVPPNGSPLFGIRLTRGSRGTAIQKKQASLFAKLSFLSMVVSVLFFCSSEKPQSEKLNVFVSILPQKYFLDKLGGNLLDVSIMVEPGASPHSYEPKPMQMVQLSKAKAYFSIGLEFENAWLPKFAAIAKNVRIVHTDTLIAKIPSDSMSCFPESLAGNKRVADHERAGLDPHIWLSPELVKQQAQTIYEALRVLDPAHDSTFTAHYHAFLPLIAKVQDSVKSILRYDSILAPAKTFLVFHPSWGYFAREFKLRQIAIEAEGKEPSPKQMLEVMTQAQHFGLRAIFVQPQFSQQSANAIARQLHARLCVADDLAYDWAANLLSIAKNIATQ